MKHGKVTDWLALAFFVVTPIVLLVLPATFFDQGEALCPSKRFFNVECPGCGLTRAGMHLIHLDIESAIYYNYLSLIVIPILVFLWGRWTLAAAKKVGLLSSNTN